jgi:hypothetical protein
MHHGGTVWLGFAVGSGVDVWAKVTPINAAAINVRAAKRTMVDVFCILFFTSSTLMVLGWFRSWLKRSETLWMKRFFFGS